MGFYNWVRFKGYYRVISLKGPQGPLTQSWLGASEPSSPEPAKAPGHGRQRLPAGAHSCCGWG